MATNGTRRGSIITGQALPVLRFAHIVGWGKALPERIMSNHELEAIVETSDDWIQERTGIRERRIAAEEETTTHLAFKAAQAALEAANLLPTDVDLIVVATSTPEHIFPSTASLVQDRLGANRAGAYDLSAACSGFVYGLDMAASKIRTGDIDIAVVIGAETMSRVLDWTDRGTCILFGDGAGAVVLQGKNEPGGVMASVLRSDGAGWDTLGIPTVGSRDTYLKDHLPLLARPNHEEENADLPERSLHHMHMNGREVYRFATRVVPESIKEAAQKAHLNLDQISLIIPHQANKRITDYIAKQLKLPQEKVYSNVDRYGNTSAASIPIALSEAVDENRIRPGDYVVFSGFGGGLSWATMVVEWSAITAEEDKIMNIRRRVIYWYAVRRRNFLKLWRKVLRFFGATPPEEEIDQTSTRQRLDEAWDDAKHRFEDVREQARDRFGDARGQARDQVKRLQDRLSSGNDKPDSHE